MARRLLPPALVLLAALLACWPMLGGSFVYDDEYYVVRNPAVITEASPWTSPLGDPSQALWRPLTVATYRAQWDGSGDARPFHAVNLALHALAALALLGLGRALGLGPGGSLAAALLFATHPVHAEAVAWVSGRSELLAALFVLLAWRAHLSPARGAGLLSAALLGLALLSKENAVVAPLLFAIGDGALRAAAARRGAPLRAMPWRRLAGLCALVLVAGLARSSVLPQSLPGEAPFGDLPLGHRALVAANIMGRSLTLLLWPASLRVFHHRDEFTSPDLAWLGAVALGLLTALLLRRRHPLAAALLVGVPVSLLTVLNLIPIGATFAERFLYLPSAAACLCAGLLLAERGRTELRSGRGLGLSVLLTVLLLGAAIPQCRRATAVFHDDLSLWAQAAAVAPDLAHTRYNHGYSLEAAGQLLATDREHPGAADELRASLRLDPRHFYAGFAHQILGNLAGVRHGRRLADPILAATHYRAALERRPSLVEAGINLASLALQAPGVVDREEALAVLVAVEREPGATPEQRLAIVELRAALLAPLPEESAAPSGEGAPP